MTTYKLIDEKYNFAKVEPKIELIKNKELRIEGTFSNDLTYILNTLHCDELLRFEDLTVEEYQERINYFADDRL